MKLIKISISCLFLFLVSCDANISEEERLKNNLVEISKRIFDRKLNFGTGGDISIRIPDKDIMIVKATGHCFGDLNEDRLSTLNLNGEVIAGNPNPSHEAEIHCAIYRERPNIKAIMHVHSTYVTAWSSSGLDIPAITQQSVKILKTTKRIPYYAVGSKELYENVVSAYKNDDIEVVVMENHGVFIAGKTLEEIFYKADLLENTAKIAYLSEQLGNSIIINE